MTGDTERSPSLLADGSAPKSVGEPIAVCRRKRTFQLEASYQHVTIGPTRLRLLGLSAERTMAEQKALSTLASRTDTG